MLITEQPLLGGCFFIVFMLKYDKYLKINMPEKLVPQINESREARYQRDYESTPEQKHVDERVEQLAIPLDPTERADDIIKNFANSGLDIDMLSQAVHQVLVPDIETKPTDYVMAVQGPDGISRKELAQPSERADLYEYAAKLIRELGELRDGENDEDFLERASSVIALALVQAHPYANGNGRTARFIGGLLRDGPQSEDLRVLGGERPESGFRISSYIPRDEALSAQQVLQAAAALDTPLHDTQKYHDSSRKAFMTPFY